MTLAHSPDCITRFIGEGHEHKCDCARREALADRAAIRKLVATLDCQAHRCAKREPALAELKARMAEWEAP